MRRLQTTVAEDSSDPGVGRARKHMNNEVIERLLSNSDQSLNSNLGSNSSTFVNRYYWHFPGFFCGPSDSRAFLSSGRGRPPRQRGAIRRSIRREEWRQAVKRNGREIALKASGLGDRVENRERFGKAGSGGWRLRRFTVFCSSDRFEEGGCSQSRFKDFVVFAFLCDSHEFSDCVPQPPAHRRS
jgi:hypothetical protein